MDNRSALSVIVPVYNEAGSIIPFYKELNRAVPDFLELIWVNDGSQDETLAQIRGLADRDKRVRCLSFSRNFGHQAALVAGLQAATGQLLVMMDGDLQHPPSLLPDMLQRMESGFDLVSARRQQTGQISWWKKSGSRLFYRLINFLSDTPIEANVADFRLFNRKVADALLQFEERELFLRGLFSWIGFRSTTIPYDAPARTYGRTKYSLSRMARLGLKGTLSFSFKPIRVALFLGGLVSLLAFAFALFAVISYFRGETVPGWSSTIIAIMMLGGIQLIMIGLIGEYIASLYSEVKKRPLFLIDEKINC
jgi:dolichol-phosphate mannosyltransferase